MTRQRWSLVDGLCLVVGIVGFIVAAVLILWIIAL